MADQGMITGADLGEEIEEGLLKLRIELMNRLDSLGVNLCGLHIDISLHPRQRNIYT